ncbi:BID domain-containing T4SS effector [Bartonella taylorii]|uniref:BID domain-containing T4SS effector n=1 Tax=Bartonella taylorii TaxID=33046 RepID=UPI001ABA454C|nr:BID domain-containing T4SS effector [Bartonella taylorii]
MKKNQSYSSFYFFMKELRQLYGQLIIGTSTSEKLYVTPDSQEKTATFSEATLVDRVQCDPLVVAHAKLIMRWSLVVYGKKDILQKEMRDIIKNPALGNELSWKIATDPQSVHKFAGMNACGFKSGTRQNAEQAIMSLCGSIEDYIQVVKHKRDYLSSQTQQESCEQPERHAATPQNLHELLHHPEREKGPLTNERIVEMFHDLSSIRIYEEQIKFWCTKVYGDSNVLTKKIMEIRKNPASGDDLLDQVTKDPTSIHRLSGVNICGLKNKVRKNAENSISSLCNSIKLCSDTVKQAKEYIIKNHVKRQEFADISKVTQTIHHAKERQHRTPSQERIRKVERAKGIALAM